MASATVARWSRTFVAVGAVFLVAWALTHLLGEPRSVGVTLGLYGFVFSVVFGKGYALLPAYFARELAFPRAPAVHLPLHVLGVLGLAANDPALTGPAAVLWGVGVLVFVVSIGWTVRDNVTGAETGTTDVNVHRVEIDRFANAFVPVVLLYLLLAAAHRVGATQGLVSLTTPAITHVLAAGAATLLVFAVGFRLLPRFLVVSPSRLAVRVVLPAGALGPALLVTDFLGGVQFQLGATLIALAVIGFALSFLDMYRRTDRDRVGFHGVALGALAGIVTVAIGLHFAFTHPDGGLATAHYRLAVGGFLGLTIVGVSYQFYPPAIGSTPGVGNRTALASILALAVGLALEAVGVVTATESLELGGSGLVLVGAVLYAFVVLDLFLERWHQRR